MKHNILIVLLFLLYRSSPVVAGEWEIVTEMPVPVSGAVAFTHDSLIYIFGGHNSRDFITPAIMQIYDPIQNNWHVDTLGTFQKSRYGATGGIWRDTAYFFGGQTDNITTNMDAIKLLNDSELALSNNDDNFNRYFASSQIYKGRIFCFGGYSVNSADINRLQLPYIFIYDLATNMVEAEIKGNFTNELPYYQMTARIRNKIYILGGAYNGVLNTITYFDTETGTLNRFESKLSKARYGGTAHALGDSAIILIGGWDGRDQVLNDIEIIDIKNPVAISNTKMTPLNHARAEHVSVKFGDTLYVFGGRSTADNADISEVEMYDLDLVSGIATGKNIQPVLKLYDNYPNPFNSSTEIKYQLSEIGMVILNIYDVAGCLIETLLKDIQTPGEHKITFNASSLSSGLYFYTLISGNQSYTKRMILIK